MSTQESKRRSHLQNWDGTQQLNANTLPDAIANQESQGLGQGVKIRGQSIGQVVSASTLTATSPIPGTILCTNSPLNW